MPFGVGIGIGVANIAEAGRAEQGVGDGVQHHIGVAMPGEAARVRNADAAKQQRPAFFQAMSVVTNSDAHMKKPPNRGDVTPADGL